MVFSDLETQIEQFKKGCPKIKLRRPCTLVDGIRKLPAPELKRWVKVYEQAAQQGRAMKFIPASGAATRMFRGLEAKGGELQNFFEHLSQFAFYRDLQKVLKKEGLEAAALLQQKKHKTLLKFLFTPAGLNFSALPKGLLPFHDYPQASRTAFEEHCLEAMAYVRDGNNVCRLHFTVSPEHATRVEQHFEELKSKHLPKNVGWDIKISTQQASTDTLVVDLQNRPLRDSQGRPLLRPSGHGALLENLQTTQGEIVFIKNIDNILPERFHSEVAFHQKVLGGYLVGVQEKVHFYLKKLGQSSLDEILLEEIFQFYSDQFFMTPPSSPPSMNHQEQVEFLFSRLNRPLRVCGMVPHQGEIGGGPFWVEGEDGSLSLQIVEGPQIDGDSPEQKKIFHASTHFNPVDLVCGLWDYRGQPFDLKKFVDPQTSFIAHKTYEGMEIKTLERPGLWNGSMASWNTIFVEVPASIFRPVKNVMDLLRTVSS